MVKAFPDPIPLPGRKNHSLKIFDHCLPHLLIMLAVKLQYSRVPWIKHKNKTNLRISSSQGIRKVPRVWPSHSFMTLIIFGMQLPCSSTGMRLHIWACRPVGTCDYKLEDPPLAPLESCVSTTLFCTAKHRPMCSFYVTLTSDML